MRPGQPRVQRHRPRLGRERGRRQHEYRAADSWRHAVRSRAQHRTEDNLPSYHLEIVNAFGRDGAWGTWVHRWTAEEDRHSTALRDYLHTTRAVDPYDLERMRIQQVGTGFTMDQPYGLATIAYVALQELATRISHRNTGAASGDAVCEALLTRIAADENLHMVFYRSLLQGALNAWPDQAMRALADTVLAFRMPGHAIPGFERMSASIAVRGIYNLRIHHDDVLVPILRSVTALHRRDLGPAGERARDELGTFMERLDREASRQEETIHTLQARRSRQMTE
jgi:acyl-[acyl-carrier-protein] desaturase